MFIGPILLSSSPLGFTQPKLSSLSFRRRSMEGDSTTMEVSCSPSLSTPLSQDDSFVWDEASQLYYRSRSGFYHDPRAGWYCSSIDGLYYKYEDGNYVLLDTNTGCQSEIYNDVEFGGNNEETQEEHAAKDHIHDIQRHSSLIEEDDIDKSNHIEVSASDGEASDIPPPTSDWLEETLIDMYLSGYKNLEPVAAAEEMSFERDEIGNVDDHKEEEEEEGVSWEEENWRAQYGQVIHREEETTPEFSIVDIWDWGIIREPEKEGNIPVARLVGRLVQPSTKLHPSMPLGGGRLKPAPICEVHLDLVRVKSEKDMAHDVNIPFEPVQSCQLMQTSEHFSTGQVYRLRSPSAGYLTTLSCYDSSNPTKDWGFPELSVENKSTPSQSNTDSTLHLSQSDKNQKSHAYRDRAAERRALHGGFGIGPGQKKTADGSHSSSPPPSSEEAAAEALEMSFGDGSYAQKILKNMGWQAGEALGRTKQGLTEPLVAVGNKGSAGLGWHHGQIKHP